MEDSFISEEMSGLTDEQLVLLAQGGDVEALNAIATRMRKVAKKCAAVCVRLYGSDVSLEDLVQEGMFGFLSAVRTYSAGGSASFRTYAAVCMRNKMTSVFRSLDDVKTATENDFIDDDVPDFGANPEDMVIANERWQSLSDFMTQEFSAFEKKVMRLYLSGNSYSEIAEILSSHTKAVDNALQRIRRKLKKLA